MEDDDYPWDVGRTDPERAFLAQLRQLSSDRAHFDVWTFYPQLVVTLTIADRDHNVILRTLRVDFDEGLRGGNDPSHQIDPDLDPADPDYFERSHLGSAAASAEYAFEWFRQQAQRPIDRSEWSDPGRVWLRWAIAEDPEKSLVAQGFNLPERPADRIVRLDPRQI